MCNLPIIVQCYGITKDPETNNFMMVIAYAENGSLRQYLNNNFNSLSWNEKLNNLLHIALGLGGNHDGKGINPSRFSLWQYFE